MTVTIVVRITILTAAISHNTTKYGLSMSQVHYHKHSDSVAVVVHLSECCWLFKACNGSEPIFPYLVRIANEV